MLFEIGSQFYHFDFELEMVFRGACYVSHYFHLKKGE